MLAVLLVTSCTSSSASGEQGDDAKPRSTSSARPAPPRKPVALTIAPGDRAAGVEPGAPVTIAAVDGKVTQVLVVNEAGQPVAGVLSPDATTWQTTEPLGFGKTYTATATGRGTDGKDATVTSVFSTAAPRVKADLSMNPLDGQVVGVGQPLAFYFDAPVANKAAAQQAIQVHSEPAAEGAFYWYSDKEVHWRPKEYWAAGTRITINASIYGRDFGNGVYGNDSRTAVVTVGDAVVANADGATHQMTVTVNGAVVRTIPISMGKPGHETPVGTYVVMSEHTDYTMDSSTYGVPADAANGYRTTVAVASRMSNSGIFYHSAPWSVGDQGHRNVSHGCINMTTENARWLQSISNKGDVIVVQNSGGPVLESWDGLGDWQVPWDQWAAGGKK
ncbi:L,D-transpeptidase [Actinophytocola oryzae]|uniref:Peptidoglycan transpeptidase (ErfK-YbiS-YhnG family) n=1 Tax=Actinophytocola oryzae TaxID=502181 RepID=A0A4R7VRL8_9PSEU|nr:Ig-like domain-containing protein [Actinophytocola oryzae]TDV52009.1 peptidoglycan transpeptidase precursor (ErfK-YbiS-YhnG family) [Actinophytocola oryzae]